MSTLLDVRDVSAGYGHTPVLRGVSLHVDSGEVVALVGANGAGKSTLLRTVTGLLQPTAGDIRFDGSSIASLPAYDIVARGLAMVPEGGRLFPFMTVLENLELGAYPGGSRRDMAQTLDDVMALFPILRERRSQAAGSLSGGERQMCAIARALMSRPRMLMLDEPSLGLSPAMLERVFDLIRTVVASRDLTVLVVEQNVADALDMASRAYVIEGGVLVKTGPGRELLDDPDIQRAYLGI
jgi:branched-chain amino acid transport system ATP-binding protein